MKKTKILSALLALSLICTALFAGCGKDNQGEDKGLTCSITVTAADVLENPDLISADKLSIVPENGIIYENDSVSFTEGENLYDILVSALQEAKVQFESEGGNYFTAFGNIYASDCTYGGWLYKVNGVEPTVGSDQYIPADGDEIEFFYVCDYNAYYANQAA